MVVLMALFIHDPLDNRREFRAVFYQVWKFIQTKGGAFTESTVETVKKAFPIRINRFGEAGDQFFDLLCQRSNLKWLLP